VTLYWKHQGYLKPEQFFIKAMTGGSKDITTMTPEELSLIKGAYAEKYNRTPLKDEQIYAMAKVQEVIINNLLNRAMKSMLPHR
jgi:hypothetical protein